MALSDLKKLREPFRESQYTEVQLIRDLKQLVKELNANIAVLQGEDGAYAPMIHNHDGVYAPAVHDHDARYYTEAEIDAFQAANAKLNQQNTFTQRQTVQTTNDSVQIKLERVGTSAGHGWIGADSGDMFNVRNSAFARKAGLTQAGYWTVPDQPAFSVYQISSAISTGVIIFTTAVLNRGPHYNGSNGYFYAPVTGAYEFTATVFVDMHGTATQYGYIQFLKNGVATGPYTHSLYSGAAAINYEPITMTQIIQLNAGDNVGVYFIGGNGGTTYTGPYSHFSGHLIG